MRSRVCWYLGFLILFCLATIGSALALAQTGTTSIRGTVSDKSGAVIPDAQVKLTSRDLAVERTTATNQSGQYEFPALQPGKYDLTVESKGFRKFNQTDIELLVNNPATVNVLLQVGTSTETVEVSA
jgi:Carboxypeptidase regulatory-like domain